MEFDNEDIKIKQKVKKKDIELDDPDYSLILTLRDLTKAIQRLSEK